MITGMIAAGGSLMGEISINEKELLRLIGKLIEIDSVNPVLVEGGAGESRIADYIGAYLDEMGLEITYQSIAPGRKNVVGVLRGSGGGRTLMLNGHTDTVSVSGMDADPFYPRFEDGRVYGRGALDMKGGLAAMIAALKSITEAGMVLKGDVILAFVADEEYKSIGTEFLLKEFSPDAAVVCEPTDTKTVVAHKGFAWATVEIFGRKAHGSRPDEGVDAITKAGKVLVEIENLERNVLAVKNHPLLGSPSVHSSTITGGVELSSYPDHCQLKLERRTLPGEDRETFVRELSEIIESIRSKDEQFNAMVDVFFHRPPFEIPEDHEIVQLVKESVHKIAREDRGISGVSFWTDAALMMNAGISTVIFGPTGEGLHAKVEYVEFDSVIETGHVLADVIFEFCSS